MQDTDDMKCLREYARDDSQEAFAAIVRRRVDMVYSAALRQVAEAHLAEDVTQIVFIALARKARKLIATDVVLSAWLLRATRLTALDLRKHLARRRKHETKAAEMRPTQTPDLEGQMWSHIRPLLDGALEGLAENDRRAIVLRYFEERSLREVGEVMGVTEEAARQRVWRATERLRAAFAARGVAVPSVSIVAAISSHAIHAAPPALAAVVTKAAIGAGATTVAAPWLTKGAIYLMAWTKTQLGIAAAAAALLMGGGATVYYITRPPTPQTIIIDPKSAPVIARGNNQPSGPDLSADAKSRFIQAYSLGEGQSLKRVAPPFIPERTAYLKHIGPDWMTDSTTINDVTQFSWRGGAPELNEWMRGNATVGGVLKTVLKIPGYKLEIQPADRNRPLKGDWVSRPDTTLDQKLNDLAKVLREQLQWPVHFEKRNAERMVYVARGRYTLASMEPTGGDRNMVSWFVGDKPAGNAHGRAAGDLRSMLVALGETLNREVVDETDSPKASAFWADYLPPELSGPLGEQLLKNVTAQTSITFSLEPRKVDYWAAVPDKADGGVAGVDESIQR
jgi:RNA polymerase sigma factor (sigma-70 family)